jgi:hypothetical protein
MVVLAIRFLAELSGLAALGCLGATPPQEPPWRIALGLGAPLLLAEGRN